MQYACIFYLPSQFPQHFIEVTVRTWLSFYLHFVVSLSTYLLNYFGAEFSTDASLYVSQGLPIVETQSVFVALMDPQLNGTGIAEVWVH